MCLEGRTDSGYRHLDEAIARGARIVVVKHRCDLNDEIYQIITDNERKTGAEIARLLHEEMLKNLKFVFITGTKGKSTTAKILSRLLCDVGIPTATVGTLGVEFSECLIETKNTTPDLFTILPYLARVYQMGARMCVLEVSSQALADKRIDGLRADVAIFTGLSVDHIDENEHKSFRDYYLAKRRLFSEFGVKVGIAPLSCEYARDMLSAVQEQHFVDTKEASDLTLKIEEMSKSGIYFTDGKHRGFLSLSGEFNLKNAALALLCASMITGMPPDVFYPVLSKIHVSGRLEMLRVLGRDVLIDYAHNAESVRALGSLVRELFDGSLIAVIGSVGDRARGRRRDLAVACEEAFDFTVLTEDDSENESSSDIARELHSYFSDAARAICVLPRERAILHAFRRSRAGDVILLLGKGHERTIVRNGVRYKLDEREILEKIQQEEYGKI